MQTSVTKRSPALTKNEMRPTTSPNSVFGALAGRLDRIEHADGGGKRKGEFLHRRRAGLLQMVGADIHRIPLRHFLGREQDHVLGQPHRRYRRKHIGSARQIFLDDVVLRRAGELLARHALLVGERHIEREQPGGGRVDRHRRVHLAERDAVKQHAHVADMRDRHADLADLTLGERMIAVVTGLGRQIEGDRKAGLPLAQILAVERVRCFRIRVARIGAENPRFIALWLIAHEVFKLTRSGAANVTRILLRCNMQKIAKAAKPRLRRHAKLRRIDRRSIRVSTDMAIK